MSGNDDFRTGRHVVYDLHAHIVLTPKYRKSVMSKRVHDTIYKSCLETCDRRVVVLEEFNTDYDHAYLVVSYPPKVRLLDFVGALKTRSAKDVRACDFEEVKEKL